MSNWFPPEISTFGQEIDAVFWLIFWLGLAGFIIAEGIIIYALIRFRRGSGRKAEYVTGNSWRQASWILIPGAIVLFLDLAVDFAGGHAYHMVKGELPASDIKVRVQGEQYAWRITYPGPDGLFDTPDDRETLNQLHVPIHRPVHVYLRSKDVIHSFFVPALRLKQDALPGREIPLWFEADVSGVYEIACAELCGPNHYTMRGFLNVHTADEYQAWVSETWGDN